MYDYTICETCNNNPNKCEYRNMSLLQYCDQKNIPYTFKNGGNEIWLSIGHIDDNNEVVELKKEINRTNNVMVDTSYDWLVVK